MIHHIKMMMKQWIFILLLLLFTHCYGSPHTEGEPLGDSEECDTPDICGEDTIIEPEASVIKLIDDELADTQNLISLYQKKVTILSEIRGKIFNDIKYQAPENFAEVERRLLEALDASKRDTGHTSFGTISHTEVETIAPQIFEDYFTERFRTKNIIYDKFSVFSSATMVVPPRARVSLTEKGITVPNTILVICTMDKNGNVHLLDTSTEEIIGVVTFDVGADNASRVYCSISNARTWISVATQSGKVYYQNASISFFGEIFSGDQSHSGAENLRWFTKASDVTTFDIPADSEVTHVSYQYKMNRKDVVVVYCFESGSCMVYTQNGERVGEIRFHTPVYHVLSNANLLAFATQSSVHFANIQVLAQSKSVCELPRGFHVTSLAFSILSFNILYVGTGEGDLLVFDIRKDAPGHVGNRCGITSKLALSKLVETQYPEKLTLRKEASSPIQVVAIRGFIVSMIQNVVLVFNVSASGKNHPEYLASTTSLGLEDDTSLYLHRFLGNSETCLVLFSANSGFLVLDSLLQYKEVFEDMSWIRTPLFVLGITAVFMYQYMRRPSARSVSTDRSKFPMRSDHELESELNRLFEQHKAGGGVPGGGFVPPRGFPSR